ncbi:MAG TPA: DUF6223 family protein [Pyrinomonadaceae bacterium]
MEITNGILTKLIAAASLFTSQVAFAFDVPTGAITSGRARALVGGAFGLISLILGGLALFRSAGRLGAGIGRIGAMIALVLGLVGIILSVMHLSGPAGGFGTGGGRAGAIVAFVLSLTGIILSGLALARSLRRRGE